MDLRLPSCKITGAVLAALILSTFGLANADRADASITAVEHADTTVDRLRVVYVEPVGPNHPGLGRNLYVEYNDGATVIVTPCVAEDSLRCYWLASQRGNGRGHSVINLNEGHHLTIRARLIREAGLS